MNRKDMNTKKTCKDKNKKKTRIENEKDEIKETPI